MEKTRSKHNRQEMFSLIESWKEGQTNINHFCESHSVNIHVFRYWLKKHKKSSPVVLSAGEESHFVPLSFTGADHSASVAEIHFPNGVKIHLNAGVAPELVQILLQWPCSR